MDSLLICRVMNYGIKNNLNFALAIIGYFKIANAMRTNYDIAFCS